MSPEERIDFGDYLEELKQHGERGTKNDRGDFTKAEMRTGALDFLGVLGDENE